MNQRPNLSAAARTVPMPGVDMRVAHSGDRPVTPPVGLTVAESAEKPPRILPPVPDLIPPERPWLGSVGELLRGKDIEIARLRARVAELEAQLVGGAS